VTDDWPRHGVRILIEGDVLDPVDERTEPPTLFGAWHYDRATGRTRWESPSPAAQDEGIDVHHVQMHEAPS
jgi:hypothetical protein